MEILNANERKKVLVVIGTRPEAIKLAPIVLELERHRENFKTEICVTGQHREMLDQMLRVFGLRPDYDLGVMKAGQKPYRGDSCLPDRARADSAARAPRRGACAGRYDHDLCGFARCVLGLL